MRTAVSILCVLSIVFLLSACNKGDDGSSGGSVKSVGFEVIEGTEKVVCYNADKNQNLGSVQICEWYCATYATDPAPANCVILFDLAPELTVPDTEADYTYAVQNPLPCK